MYFVGGGGNVAKKMFYKKMPPGVNQVLEQFLRGSYEFETSPRCN